MFRATVHLTFSFTVLWCGQVGACLSKQLVRKQEGIQQFRAKVDTFKEQAAVKAGKFFKVQHLVEKKYSNTNSSGQQSASRVSPT